MRISDWSSDVCSSDLGRDGYSGCISGRDIEEATMRQQMLGGLAGLLTLAGLLAGCAAPSSLTPVPEARAAREIEGVWLGDFITVERRFEPATFILETPADRKSTRLNSSH